MSNGSEYIPPIQIIQFYIVYCGTTNTGKCSEICTLIYLQFTALRSGIPLFTPKTILELRSSLQCADVIKYGFCCVQS